MFISITCITVSPAVCIKILDKNVSMFCKLNKFIGIELLHGIEIKIFLILNETTDHRW